MNELERKLELNYPASYMAQRGEELNIEVSQNKNSLIQELFYQLKLS